MQPGDGSEPAAGARFTSDDLEHLPDTLEYFGEFGTELITFLPFVTWLSEKGLLRDRVVKSYQGMESFYRHLQCRSFIGKRRTRGFIAPRTRRGLPILHEDTFDLTYSPCSMHSYPDFRSLFQDVDLRIAAARTGKPILIVHNKFNDEWTFQRSVNHLTESALDRIFEACQNEYQIVYIRHGMGAVDPKFSQDHNVSKPGLEDAAVLERFPKVANFDDLFQEHREKGGVPDVNLFKNGLYSRCYHFISAQGGGTYQCAYFSGSLLMIQHRAGVEHRWPYVGYFSYLAKPPVTLAIAMRESELMDGLRLFQDPTMVDGTVTIPAEKTALLGQLSPGRPALRDLPLPREMVKSIPPL